MTTDETRRAANGPSQAINQISKIAGPAMGGALMFWLHPQSILLPNLRVSLLAAGMMLRLDLLPRPPGRGWPARLLDRTDRQYE